MFARVRWSLSARCNSTDWLVLTDDHVFGYRNASVGAPDQQYWTRSMASLVSARGMPL